MQSDLTEGKISHLLERYHFVVSTLALRFKTNLGGANPMDGISIAGGGKMADS